MDPDDAALHRAIGLDRGDPPPNGGGPPFGGAPGGEGPPFGGNPGGVSRTLYFIVFNFLL